MPRINYMINKHKIHSLLAPFARAYMPKINKYDHWRVGQLGRAMQWIEQVVIDTPNVAQSCDETFQLLPGKRTFKDLWRDPNIWISFHTDPDPELYAEAVSGGPDIAVAYGSFRHGWQMVAATLIHEFAHINGHVTDDHSSEDTLLFCGMQYEHNETIIGYLRTMPKNAVSIL